MKTIFAITILLLTASNSLSQKRFNHETVVKLSYGDNAIEAPDFEAIQFLDYADIEITNDHETVKIEFDLESGLIYYRNRENFTPALGIVIGEDTMTIRFPGGFAYIEKLEFEPGNFYFAQHPFQEESKPETKSFDFCKGCEFELYREDEIVPDE